MSGNPNTKRNGTSLKITRGSITGQKNEKKKRNGLFCSVQLTRKKQLFEEAGVRGSQCRGQLLSKCDTQLISMVYQLSKPG